MSPSAVSWVVRSTPSAVVLIPTDCRVRITGDIAGHSQTERGRDVDAIPVDDEWLVHTLQYPVGDSSGFVFVHTDQQDGKFVPSKTDDAVLGPDGSGEACGELGKDRIPGPVAVSVIDAFEIVEIDEKDPYP
jgi:hypothetical protein